MVGVLKLIAEEGKEEHWDAIHSFHPPPILFLSSLEAIRVDIVGWKGLGSN